MRRAREAEVDGRDDDPTPEGTLEYALAVAECTVLGGDDAGLQGIEVDDFDRFDDVGGFGPVGADVLDGGGPHRTRNGGQVFRSPESVLGAEAHEVVPGESRLGMYGDAVTAARVDAAGPADGVKQQAVEVAGEEDVVSSADHGRPARCAGRSCEVFAQAFGRVELRQPGGPGVDSEAVAFPQGGVEIFLYHNGANLGNFSE